jgi:hypothetical protein
VVVNNRIKSKRFKINPVIPSFKKQRHIHISLVNFILFTIKSVFKNWKRHSLEFLFYRSALLYPLIILLILCSEFLSDPWIYPKSDPIISKKKSQIGSDFNCGLFDLIQLFFLLYNKNKQVVRNFKFYQTFKPRPSQNPNNFFSQNH